MKKMIPLRILGFLALTALPTNNAQAMKKFLGLGRSSSSKESSDERLTRKIEEFSRAQTAVKSGKGSPESRDARAAELKSALRNAPDLTPENRNALENLHRGNLLPTGKERATSAHQPYSVRREIEKALPNLRNERLERANPISAPIPGTFNLVPQRGDRTPDPKFIESPAAGQDPKKSGPASVNTESSEASNTVKRTPPPVPPRAPKQADIVISEPSKLRAGPTPNLPKQDAQQVELATQQRDAQVQQKELIKLVKDPNLTSKEKLDVTEAIMNQGIVADKAQKQRIQLEPKQETEKPMTSAALTEAAKQSPPPPPSRRPSPQQRDEELGRIDAEASKKAKQSDAQPGWAKVAPSETSSSGVAIGKDRLPTSLSEIDSQVKKPVPSTPIEDLQPIKRSIKPVPLDEVKDRLPTSQSEIDSQVKKPVPSTPIDDLQPIKRPTPTAPKAPSTTESTPIPTSLAQQIQAGTTLKKVDPEVVAQEKKMSQDPAEALKKGLAEELEKRREVIKPSKADKAKAKAEEEAFWSSPAA